MSQEINLYDPSLRIRRDLFGFAPAMAAVGLAVACIAAGAGFARWSLAGVTAAAARTAAELETQQAAVRSVAERSAGNKLDKGLQAELARTERTLQQRRDALKSVHSDAGGRDAGFAGDLQALARQSIEGLWLTGVVLRQDDVLLRGRALNPALIPAYVQRLEHEPSLRGRAFKALEVSRPPEEVAKAASQPARDAEPAPAAPQLADFVEFKLTGSGQDDRTATGVKP